MSIEIVNAEYEAMSRQDWPAVFRDAHDDFEFEPPSTGLGSGPTRGREPARKDIREFFAPYEEIVLDPQEFREAGDLIAVDLVVRTRPHGSSKMIEIRVGQLWTLREGRLARLQVFPQRESAFEAVEALEAAGRESVS